MTFKEIIFATCALIALVLVQMRATHAGALLNQVPWLDEVHTGILVNEPDAEKFHSAISAQCVDANFPVYYQALRAFHIQSLSAIRTVSLASTIAALLGIYVLLRGALRPIEAAVGVLAVWSIPEIALHAFEARFYAPWFASIIWFAVAMRWTKTAERRWLAGIAVGITSLLACTLHLLGLPAVALIVLAEMIADRDSLKSRMVRALPALVGFVTVLLFIPLVIEQKHSFAIKTWLVGNPGRLLYSTFTGLFPGVAASVILLGLFASAWWRKRDNAPPREIALRPLAGASLLIAYPFILFAVTLLFHPVLLPRYALGATAAIAAAAGYAASRMRRCAAIAVCCLLVAESGAELTRRVREAGDNSREIDARIAAIRAAPDEPALFESRHQLFPVDWTAPDLRDRCAYIDFQPGPNQLDPVVEGFERDLAKKFQRVFGWPNVMSWERVSRQIKFILIPIDNDDARIARRFDGYSIRRLGPGLYELLRTRPIEDKGESIFFELK